MSVLVWDDPGERSYEIGVDRGVFYSQDGVATPWSGLIAVSEAPSGSDVVSNHIDGFKYRSTTQGGSFAARIEAYTYPEEFLLYEGADNGITGQPGKAFGFSYRTFVGNGENPYASYKIHIVYNARVAPAQKPFTSIGTDLEGMNFAWDLTTTPVIIPTGENSAHLIIDSSIAYPSALQTLEEMLYGSNEQDPHFPSMLEVLELFENHSTLKITDNGDGTWTAEGPDDVVYFTSPTSFEINWPSAVYIDTDTYRVRSL